MMPITDAPAAASDFAMAAPMPFDAPVTTATLPVALLMCYRSFGCGVEMVVNNLEELI
jgi:hypothetical protein